MPDSDSTLSRPESVTLPEAAMPPVVARAIVALPAIANEAGLESRYIGRIDLYEDFSTIDLPDGMPKELLEHLKTVRFGKFRYNLSPLESREKPRKPKKK